MRPEDEQNYGRQREPDRAGKAYSRPGSPQRDLSVQDEKVWAALSHASVLVWPFTGFLPVAPLIIWLLFRDRSPRIGFQALQSLCYQTAWLIIGVAAGILATILTVLTLGLALLLIVPLGLLLSLVPFAHQLYAAYRVMRGSDFRYPLIADRIDAGRRGLV